MGHLLYKTLVNVTNNQNSIHKRTNDIFDIIIIIIYSLQNIMKKLIYNNVLILKGTNEKRIFINLANCLKTIIFLNYYS